MKRRCARFRGKGWRRCAGDGRCPVCDSFVRPATLVRICDECNYGSYEGRCVICGGQGISDAYYCKECTLQEKDVRPCEVTCKSTALLPTIAGAWRGKRLRCQLKC
jgi:hypothetical protein